MSKLTFYYKVLFLLLTLSLPVNATLINFGAFTSDTSSNLDWKRWDTTTNKSYNTVSDNFDFGEEFFGWRYATATEADDFLLQLGFLANPTTTFIANPESSWLSLIDLMGVDTTDGNYDYLYAMVDSPSGSAKTYQQFHVKGGLLYSTRWQHAQIGYGKATAASFLGSFLVRDSYTIPEPTSMSLLFISILIGLKFKYKFLRVRLLSNMLSLLRNPVP